MILFYYKKIDMLSILYQQVLNDFWILLLKIMLLFEKQKQNEYFQ